MLENDPAHSHYSYLKTGRKKIDLSTQTLVVVLPAAGREAELAGMEMRAVGLADLCQMPEEPVFLAVPSGCGGNGYGLTSSLPTQCSSPAAASSTQGRQSSAKGKHQRHQVNTAARLKACITLSECVPPR